MKIALIGDYDASATAHQAIPLALARSREECAAPCEWTWLPTTDLDDNPAGPLAEFDGIWCVPGSPYRSRQGALAAIRFARLEGRPFLGTCGGFQHALMEYAESVWSLPAAVTLEEAPAAVDALITKLSCSLVEQSGEIHFAPGSRVAGIYGALVATEGYHCSYGLNPGHSHRLASGPLRVSGRDSTGAVRAIELDGHPFFVATLFQPERLALRQRTPPLVRALVEAARVRAASRAAESAA